MVELRKELREIEVMIAKASFNGDVSADESGEVAELETERTAIEEKLADLSGLGGMPRRSDPPERRTVAKRMDTFRAKCEKDLPNFARFLSNTSARARIRVIDRLPMAPSVGFFLEIIAWYSKSTALVRPIVPPSG